MKPFLTVLLLLQFILSSWSHAQDLQIFNNPYDNADEIVKSRKAFQREKWFYEQRMYPNNYIPESAYEKAYMEKESLKRDNGFALMGVFDTWSSLGPTTGFYFSYSNISSRMTSVKYDPLNPNIIYIGAAYGGIWKSTNGGTSWAPLTDYQVSLSTGSIAIDPGNTNVIYYGTGEATYSAVSYYGMGLLKTTDGGASWKNVAGPFHSESFCSRIIIKPGMPSELLAAMGNGGLYRSTNSGDGWTKIVSGRCDDVVYSLTGDTAYCVGSGTGYRISYDGGASFQSSSALSLGTRNHLTISRSNPSVLYCSIYSGSSITVFKSTNAGSSFSQIVSGQNFSGSQAWYDFYIHVSPHDENFVLVGSIDIWRSTNGGSSNFTNITNGYGGGNVHVDQHNVDFHPTDPQQVLCVNDGGIWKSTNRGTSWTNLNTNQTLTQFYRIASDPSNASHILGGTQDNGTQRTTGALNWAAAFGGDGGEVCFHNVNNSYILGETQNNGIYRSTNSGASFSSSTSGLNGTAAWVGPIVSHPDSAGIFYTARQSVFKSTNWGASWSSISTGSTGTIREMAISRSNPSVMFYSVSTTIYKSTNRGYTFSSSSSGLPSKVATSISVHPDSSNVAIATFSGFGGAKIYKTTNQGNSWFSINGNLPDSPINDCIFYYPGAATSTLFAATDVGVFVSTDYGSNWIEVANGLPNTVAMHLDFHAGTNKLRIGTHGRGVYEIQLASFAAKDVSSVDAGLSGVQTFSSVNVTPSGSVKNLGSASASFTVTRKINPGGYISTVNVNSLPAQSSADVNFAAWSFSPGTTYTVKDSVYISGDINSSNDISSCQIIPYVGTSTIRINEAHNSVSYPPSGWALSVLSGTSTNFWSRNAVSSYGKGTGSSKFAFYNAPSGSVQALTSNLFSPSVAGDSLEFDLAYAARTNGSTDSVVVEASTNGGSQFYMVMRLWGSNLSGNMNTAGANNLEFTPTPSQWESRKAYVIPGTNRIRFRAVSGNGNNFFVDSIRLATKNIVTQLSLSFMPEAFINLNGGMLNVKDTVRVYLRSTAPPYQFQDSSITFLDSVIFTAECAFSNVQTGSYYIVTRHRNALETWSKSGGESITRGAISSYSFMTGISQAYGSNQTTNSAGFVSLYSGDSNNDGSIDATDLAMIDNDAAQFLAGYLSTDIDGNGFVDATDALFADNNAQNFVSVQRP